MRYIACVMWRFVRLFSAILCGISLTGCSNPTTGPSPGTISTGVTVPSVIRIGQSVRASAVIALGRGGVEGLTTGWRSDNPAIATVTDGGGVTGASNGRATIYVLYGGKMRGQQIRVVPDFEG